MPEHLPPPATADGPVPDPVPGPGLRRKVLRYAAGSGVATVCSEVAFVLVYGVFGASPAVASTIGWLAGAVPNYWLNRTWTWQRRGRPSLRHELLPYIAIVLATLFVAVVATSAVHARLPSAQVSDAVRLVLVSGTFLAVYGVIFLVRFFLLDRLFRRAAARPAAPAAGPSRPRPAPSASSKENV